MRVSIHCFYELHLCLNLHQFLTSTSFRTIKSWNRQLNKKKHFQNLTKICNVCWNTKERKLELKKKTWETSLDIWGFSSSKMTKEIIFVCGLSLKIKIKIFFEGTRYRLAIISQIQELQFLLLGRKNGPHCD